MIDLISRQAAIDEFCSMCDRWDCSTDTCARAKFLRDLPSVSEHTETLLSDGTLMLECDSDISKVTRVNVRQRGTHNGDLFYRDED